MIYFAEDNSLQTSSPFVDPADNAIDPMLPDVATLLADKLPVEGAMPKYSMVAVADAT